MKIIFSLIFLCIIGMLSCTDEDKIAAVIRDGEEIELGSNSPIVLAQNYPNPFNPATRIEYGVAYSMHITLKVLTEDWQEVITLVNDEVTAPGYYAVTFSSGDLPSGEYYYMLEGSDITIVRRMRLLK